MLDMVTTNGATILTMLVLWSTVIWAFTYIYMGHKVQKLNECIESLDWYCYYSDIEVKELLAEKGDWVKATQFNYADYYLTDKGMEVL